MLTYSHNLSRVLHSTWDNIQIHNLPSLNIGLDDGSFAIENNQITYESEHLAIISDVGSSITAYDKIWPHFPLTMHLATSELGNFVVSFDYLLRKPRNFTSFASRTTWSWAIMMTPKTTSMTPSVASGSMHLTQETIMSSSRVTIWLCGELHRYVANLSK